MKRQTRAVRVNVGSENKSKLRAVQRAFQRYGMRAIIAPKRVSSGVRNQPFSLAETARGAANRARRAFDSTCVYSVGLEAGLVRFPGTKTGFMDVPVCAVYDGKTLHLGAGPAFEYPASVLRSLKNGGEVKHYFQKLTGQGDIHETIGAVGFLSKGAVARDAFQEQAVLMALIPIASPEHYAPRRSPRARPPIPFRPPTNPPKTL